MSIREIVRRFVVGLWGNDGLQSGAGRDHKKYLSDLHALTWEEHYHRRECGKDTGKAFLPELTDLDSDFAEALSGLGIRKGRMLEIGSGSGFQAIQYARMGFAVTATEVSGIAIRQASALPSKLGVSIEFVQDNILYTKVDGHFDIVADRGCYTVLPQDCLGLYAANVARLLRPGGCLLLTLDGRTKDRMEALHSLFDVVSSTDTHYQVGEPDADESLFPALFVTLRHRNSGGRGEGNMHASGAGGLPG